MLRLLNAYCIIYIINIVVNLVLIKKIGLYDTVKELLRDCEIYELSGIQPNPKVDSVNAGAKICKENDTRDVYLPCGHLVDGLCYVNDDKHCIYCDIEKFIKNLENIE